MDKKIILHQVKRSAYSEKIRLMLDIAGLDWLRVDAPTHTNKREVQRLLVEGYSRRIPLLQVGADMYCDTDVITHQLALLSGRKSFSKENLGDDRQMAIEMERGAFIAFLSSIPKKQLLSSYFKDYSIKDFSGFLIGRVQSFKGVEVESLPFDQAVKEKEGYLHRFNDILKNQTYLLMDLEPAVVDFSLYHHVWYQELNNNLHTIEKYPHVMKWYRHMKSMRKSLPTPIDGMDALKTARENEPAEIPEHMLKTSRIGSKVSLQPNDFAGQATLPVSGVIVGEDEHKIILRRETKETGVIHVHFPKNALGACM
ncbi:glutathione S-transferase family protein [Acidaminobacter sp. JC074]|uniref:glutathione S-transferase N-terminal domain-containing protein n=1 Tax=Acidaminobacter sp. JC074 TaxID=2530199 RepID=UPI001F1103A5|nr:glutathione S-transferase family protein [Acidaminobacter sp. JC074]MCH4887654.1 glutathione S-transferase family protein [Acidaminobacter sp. JC074]